jgi:hypothetical protein
MGISTTTTKLSQMPDTFTLPSTLLVIRVGNDSFFFNVSYGISIEKFSKLITSKALSPSH